MNPFSCKVLGAASERGLSVQQIKSLGDTLVANSVTIGTSLDHCHVPGRPKQAEEWGALPQDACEIGMGIHNEPGFKRLDKTPPPDKLIGEMLSYMLDPQDADRHYIDLDQDDAPILFINNLGGLSNLELFAIADETIEQLGKTYGLHPSRVYANAYMTSLNAPGFGITLVKHKPVTKAAGVDLLDLLDDPTDAYSWTGVSSGWGKGTGVARDRQAEEDEAAAHLAAVQKKGGSVSLLDADARENADGPVNGDPELVKKVLLAAADYAIKAEPEMTRNDTIVGDGDAGETLAQVAKAVQKALKNDKIDLKNAAGTCLTLGEVIESNMGGTSGAIYALYFAGLVQGLVGGPGKAGQAAGQKEWAHAAFTALEKLEMRTPARPGHRTLMDPLNPFCKTLGEGKSLAEAVDAATVGAAETKKMTPRLGRATYQGEGNSEMYQVEDPGATGIVAIVKGILSVLS
jgi:triose/dihydroxyacetone kinase / FAD-AMP lyase (cyclizing)